jgi:hypothetical protein
MLPVIVLASLVALLCGIAHFVLRARHLRRAQIAQAYQVACQEAVQLLRRYRPSGRGADPHFQLGKVPLELQRTLLDGLQILAAHVHLESDDEELPSPSAGQLQELQSSLAVVRTIAEGKVPAEGRKALRALFVDAAFEQLQSLLPTLQPSSSASSSQVADLCGQIVPAARDALEWKQDGLTVSHQQLSTLLGDTVRLLHDQGLTEAQPPTAGSESTAEQDPTAPQPPDHDSG